MRERVKQPPCEEVVQYLIRPRLDANSQASFGPLMDLNRAHVVMLAAQGIMARPDAGALIRVMDEVRAKGVEDITWDPALEEVYFNLEAHIIREAGAAIGGQLHTARSRNDLGAALARISARTKLLSLSAFLQRARRELLGLARAHVGTIVTGYTHMQPAQPTTLGHYLHAVANGLERDDLRLQQAYAVVNLSPLGACAFNATGFPIDRSSLAEMTGFSGLVENSIDALASRDYVSQILSAIAILGVDLSRLAQDLYVWQTDEFGWLEVGDDVATTSSIMPQKKNPITLEHIRSKASHMIGATMAALTAQKGISYGHLRDISLETSHPLRDAFHEAEAALALTAVTLRSLKVKDGVAEARAAENFSTVTELADVMVREAGLSFREAHAIVGAAVSELIDRRGRPSDITPDRLSRLSTERFGRPLDLAPETVRRALSPAGNVEIRSITGGPSPAEAARSIDESVARFEAQTSWWRDRHADLERAQRRLDEAAADLAQA